MELKLTLTLKSSPQAARSHLFPLQVNSHPAPHLIVIVIVQRETWPLPLCDQRHPCGVRWLEHLDQKIVHIVEERPGGLGGLPYFEVKLCALITNTPDNNAFKKIL